MAAQESPLKQVQDIIGAVPSIGNVTINNYHAPSEHHNQRDTNVAGGDIARSNGTITSSREGNQTKVALGTDSAETSSVSAAAQDSTNHDDLAADTTRSNTNGQNGTKLKGEEEQKVPKPTPADKQTSITGGLGMTPSMLDTQEEDSNSSRSDESLQKPIADAHQIKTDAATDDKKRKSTEDPGQAEKKSKLDKKAIFTNKEKFMLLTRRCKFKEASSLEVAKSELSVEDTLWRLNKLENIAWTQGHSEEVKVGIDKISKAMLKFGIGASEILHFAELTSSDRNLMARAIIHYRVASLLHKWKNDLEGMRNCIQNMRDVGDGKNLRKEENLLFARFLIPIMKELTRELPAVCKKLEKTAITHEAFFKNSTARVHIKAGQNEEAKDLLSNTRSKMKKAFEGDSAINTPEYEELEKLLNQAKTSLKKKPK